MNPTKPSHRITLFASTNDSRFRIDFHKRISNLINPTSDSDGKQAIQKHDSQITSNYQRLTQGDETMQSISRKSAHWQAKCKQIARKTTNPYD